MEMYRISNIEGLTEKTIISLVNKHKTSEVPRIKRLNNYYIGESDIKLREMQDTTKPNNKVANPFAAYIVDTVQGYFMGKPISYTSDDDALLEKMQIIWDMSHEQTHNSRMARGMSIQGVAYELIYVDENNNIKMLPIKAEEVFMVYGDSIEDTPICAIRHYSVYDYVTEDSVEWAEVYSASDISRYYIQGDKLRLFSREDHFFGGVPVVCYKNNDELTGDFEKVVDLIDAYDKAVSDTANNLEYFADSYLIIKDASLDLDAVPEMKEKRTMIFESGGDASFLVKPSNIAESEALKNRLKEDIHNFSFVPNLNDDSFGSATSGEGLKYKLFGLENSVSTKERMFSAGIEQRNRLITNILNIKGGSHNSDDIVAQFTRNLPSNNMELADLVVKLQGILPSETLMGLLPFVDDAAYQLELLDKEREGTLYEDLAPDTTRQEDLTSSITE